MPHTRLPPLYSIPRKFTHFLFFCLLKVWWKHCDKIVHCSSTVSRHETPWCIHSELNCHSVFIILFLSKKKVGKIVWIIIFIIIFLNCYTVLLFKIQNIHNVSFIFFIFCISKTTTYVKIKRRTNINSFTSVIRHK